MATQTLEIVKIPLVSVALLYDDVTLALLSVRASNARDTAALFVVTTPAGVVRTFTLAANRTRTVAAPAGISFERDDTNDLVLPGTIQLREAP